MALSCCMECVSKCFRLCPCNCLMCCFGFLTLCGCRDRVCRKMVYFPPEPMYQIEEADNGRQTMWIVEDGKKIDPYSSPLFKVGFLQTRRGQKIATMHIACPESTTTILYSHGNATDIGCMRDHLLDMSHQLKVNVFSYDYSGYGLSTGKPSMRNTLADGEAVFEHLIKTSDFKDSTKFIILYGQSLGSGITFHLARKYKEKVGGLVIHSGIMSALRVIQDVPTTKWFDIYPNIDIVKEIRAPLFVIHGTEDTEVPAHHGQELTLAAPNAYKPWFVEGGGHNNIEVHHREKLFKKLAQFIKDIEEGKARYSDSTSATKKNTKISIDLSHAPPQDLDNPRSGGTSSTKKRTEAGSGTSASSEEREDEDEREEEEEEEAPKTKFKGKEKEKEEGKSNKSLREMITIKDDRDLDEHDKQKLVHSSQHDSSS